MKHVAILLAVLLATPTLPALADDSGHFFRFGGGVAFMNMSEFNDGIVQSNEILRNSYRRDLWDMYPGWQESGIENEVDSATRGSLLDELNRGLGFFITFGHEFGDNLALGVEIERVVGANDIVHNPAVSSSYEAPATFYKLMAEFRPAKDKQLSFGFGGAVGWAKADGYLKMPAREPRTHLEEAFLSGGGLLIEGVVAPYYRMSEGFDVFANVGYRLAKLDESDQTWFQESDGGAAPGNVVLIDDSIPLRLDYSGLFVRIGMRADWPW
ncbi:MAG: hypothetical protein GY838_05080 [bacterium]|nr:hypothetical protein [bacterium]